MKLKLKTRRAAAALLFATAFLLTGGAFASAFATPSADAAPAGAAPASAPPAEAGLAARLALALDVLGRSVARDLRLDAAPLPAPVSDALPVLPREARGAGVSVAPLDGRVKASVDLALDDGRGAAAPPATSGAVVQSTLAAPAPAAPGAFALAAALAAIAGALAWFWPSLKEAVARTILAPLYAHVGRAEIFENGVRERIFSLVKAEPGISASELSTRSGVSWGTTIYHLDVLEQNRMVVSVKDGRYRRYFENGAATADRRETVSVLRNATSARIAERVLAAPGLTQKELAAATGLSPQALHWHAERLLRAGVVRKEREGRVVRFYRSA